MDDAGRRRVVWAGEAAAAAKQIEGAEKVLGSLRRALLEARACGSAFADVWPHAVEHATSKVSHRERRGEWQAALAATAASWHAANELRDDPLAKPVAAMRPEPAEHEPDHRRSAPRMPAIVPLHQHPKRKAA